MKVGLIPAYGGGVGTSGSYVRDLVSAAERNAFESLWVGEHIVLPVDQRTPYPGSSGGLTAPSDAPLPDPLEWLSFAAACSRGLVLGTAILLANLHHPLTLAKRLATLDQLSEGRLRLGVGIGWNPQEYEAVGIGFSARGARLEENLAAMRAVWSQERASFSGEHVSFEPVYSSPKPVRGAVPVLIGGDSDAAARRAGRLGDGYFPFERDQTRLSQLVGLMRQTAEAAGRDPSSIEVTVLGSTRPERVQALRDLGVTRMVVFMSGPDIASVDEIGARCRVALGGLAPTG